MKKALLIFGLASSMIAGCERYDPVAGNPAPTQQQSGQVRCIEKGGTWVYDNGFTCANPSPGVGR